ncbi:MAG: LIC_10190 family membrane protein [Chitinophagaceae bacterium]
MLLIGIAILYISLVCWTWGFSTLKLLKKITQSDQTNTLSLSITSLVGLIVISFIASLLSLFFPLGSINIQLFLLTLTLLLLLQKKIVTNFRKQIAYIKLINKGVILLFFLSMLLCMVMGSWEMNHPDTLAYHSQIILWIEKYKAVPGLVHLHSRFGLQSGWFVCNALFSFNFTGYGSYNYLNSTILAWYLYFIFSKINACFFVQASPYKGFLWIAMLGLNLWSYTQVRLTATSASPDFIATICIWAVFYLIVTAAEQQNKGLHWVIVLLLITFSLTIKLSAIPLALIYVYSIYRLATLQKFKLVVLAIILSLIMVIPMAIRNIITSGYALFPTTMGDFFNVDWKYDSNKTTVLENYVTAFARTESASNESEIIRVNEMELSQWVPTWWRYRSIADKSILLLLVVSIIFFLLSLRKIKKSSPDLKIALLTSMAGIVFWFVKAPDPRFGFGFILAFSALVSSYLTHSITESNNFRKIILLLLAGIGLSITSYISYRFIHFFDNPQLIYPAGIKKNDFDAIICEGVIFHIPKKENDCGNIPLPCTYNACETFQLRKKTVEEGFRAK